MLPEDRFPAFAADCESAARQSGVEIRSAVFDANIVCFEGVPNCEDFVVECRSTNRQRAEGIFEHCKTGGLPYDQLVARCLELLKQHFPELVHIEESS